VLCVCAAAALSGGSARPLGQHLVLITTNEDVGRLHPAVARPGRCLSNVEFESFDPMAARRWLHARGVSGAVARSLTLAEFYAQAGDVHVADAPSRVGFPRGDR
jgi:hypothetical protein